MHLKRLGKENMPITNIFSFSYTDSCFNTLPHISDFYRPFRKRPCENRVGKGEDACNQHFFLFPLCFQPVKKKPQISIFEKYLFCHLQRLSIWTSVKFCHLVKGYYAED